MLPTHSLRSQSLDNNEAREQQPASAYHPHYSISCTFNFPSPPSAPFSSVSGHPFPFLLLDSISFPCGSSSPPDQHCTSTHAPSSSPFSLSRLDRTA
ncbi:hypothetical protein CDL15_Pgr011842 [Punica granatum]|uniref:Uncharacterized protein n=1 Tax=Punica granatum TaxID=22663 RepID=A0A218XEJ9_PUNGR|nr:hypothetical protein CDL15_Pgr011842 [Punica granatum]